MFTLIIDPVKLVEVSWMQNEIEEITSFCKKSPPANPEEPVLIAGDPERLYEKERKAKGIIIDKNTWRQIVESAETLGLSRTKIEKMI